MTDRMRETIAGWPQEFRDEFTERAGIMEHDGGMPRELAEQQAYIYTARRVRESEGK